MAKSKPKSKRNATRKTVKKISRPNKSKRPAGKGNRKGVTKSKPVSKNKKGTRSNNPKRKNLRVAVKNAIPKNKRNRRKPARPSYTIGRGDQADQFTFWFPAGMAESKKLAFFAAWDSEPLQKYIVKGRRWKKPVYEPQSLWVKLIKRQPRHSEYYYTAQLTPPDFVVNRTTAHEFAYMTLEQYYQDYVGHIKEKILREPVQRFKSSSPDDYEGKPMKIEGIIFHFLYY